LAYETFLNYFIGVIVVKKRTYNENRVYLNRLPSI